MRVVFLGTPWFAVPSLKALIQSTLEVVAVFTQPDKPAGRGNKPQSPAVKLAALEAGIPVHQPQRIRGENLQPFFKSLDLDFIVVVAYGQILPRWLLECPRIAAVNVHGSLLPKHRGAAPVIWTILNGETVSGVTTMLMDEHLDTGAILLKRETPVHLQMTGGELAEKLSHIGASLLLPTLEGLVSGSICPVPQDDSQATWAPRIDKEQARIDWGRPASEIHNQVRAFNPWPLAFTHHGNDRLQLLESVPEDMIAGCEVAPGTFLGTAEEGMRIKCGGQSALLLRKLKPANRKPMSGREYANGGRFHSGELIFSEIIPESGLCR